MENTFSTQELYDGYQEGVALVAYAFRHNKPLDENIVKAWLGHIHSGRDKYELSIARLRGVMSTFESVRKTLASNTIIIDINPTSKEGKK